MRDVKEYIKFLEVIVERLENLKVFINAGGVHDILNIQSLILNQLNLLKRNI